MAKVEATEITVATTAKGVQLTLTLEEAACLFEYIADSSVSLNAKNEGPLNQLFIHLQNFALDTKLIKFFSAYPAREYGWEVKVEDGEKVFKKIGES